MTQNDSDLQADENATSDVSTMPGDGKEIPFCGSCGSDKVVRDAWAAWNADAQEWELQEVFDYQGCSTLSTIRRMTG
jgi:hypothetical protein